MVSRSAVKRARKVLGLATAASLVAQMLVPILAAPAPAYAASVTSASFSGGVGTYKDPDTGTLYAKQGAALTLTVSTDDNTKCVRVSDGTSSVDQTSDTAITSWTFTSGLSLFTAGSGGGTRSVTARAYRNFNNDGACRADQGEILGPQDASYTLDNTGPTVTGTKSPLANAAGWNNSNVTIDWSAADAGSGVASTPAQSSVTANTPFEGITVTSGNASDRVGNTSTGSVTVKLDKDLPAITPSRLPAANANGWNNTDVTVSFTCSDALSSIKTCTNSTTTFSNEGANQSVTGTAVDNADNSASAPVVVSIDKTKPTLSGAPITSANTAGWYNGDVTIGWTYSDGLSQIDPATVPPNSVITGEGTNLTTSASVKDKADNETIATSSPGVKIDKTAPNTTATAPANWNNVDVSVSLTANDGLSGVQSTYYKLNGGAQHAGTSVAVSAEGIHSLEFWSEDNAGNVEAAKRVEVKIDKTSPTINHTQLPVANANGWNNTNVTVTFICGDALSGIASCTAPQTVVTEGRNQLVTGTAVDTAGNSATDPATVSIDKTAPTITGSRSPEANANGWNNTDVRVSFMCGDTLSGIPNGGCPSAQTLGEGANQSVSGTATDAAGNSSSASVTGINIDKTAPSLSGAATTAPNGNGWYRDDVVVVWTCGDSLSLIDTPNNLCPTASTVTGEGSNLSASASVSDKAGNTTNRTVSGIKIDRTAPSTSASVPAPLASGWYAGAVQVTLSTGPDLSGVDKTYYSVDGGTAQEYTGPFSHSLGGEHTITFWSTDNAGNVENKTAPGHSITLKIDNVKPSITGSRDPLANSFGWNNTDITVSFQCNDAETSIAIGGCTEPVTLSDEGANQSVTGTATDAAANSASATVNGINIDKTAPTTISNVPSGWQKANVTVDLTARDQEGLSGVNYTEYSRDGGINWTQGTSVTLSSDGVHSLLFRSVDKAGNTEQSKSASVSIDTTAPVISGADVNDTTWRNIPLSQSFTASDAPSGLANSADASFTLEASAESANATTPTTVSKTVTDNAGNSSTRTMSAQIDKTAPGTPTFSGIAAQTYTPAALPAESTISCSATDALSGLDTCAVTGYSNATGTHTLTATARDKAGNTSTSQLTYTVASAAWTLQGFHQPIGITNSIIKAPGESAPTATSTTIWNAAKGGSTVPLKFNVFENSVEKTSTSAITGFNATKLSSCTGTVTDQIDELASAGSTSLRYDGVPGQGGQFIQNWKTGTVSGDTCYRVALTTQDGSAIYTFVKLRK